MCPFVCVGFAGLYLSYLRRFGVKPISSVLALIESVSCSLSVYFYCTFSLRCLVLDTEIVALAVAFFMDFCSSLPPHLHVWRTLASLVALVLEKVKARKQMVGRQIFFYAEDGARVGCPGASACASKAVLSWVLVLAARGIIRRNEKNLNYCITSSCPLISIACFVPFSLRPVASRVIAPPFTFAFVCCGFLPNPRYFLDMPIFSPHVVSARTICAFNYHGWLTTRLLRLSSTLLQPPPICGLCVTP